MQYAQLRRNYYLIWVRNQFLRASLKYLRSDRSEKDMKRAVLFLRKHLVLTDPFQGQGSVGIRFRHKRQC